MTTPEHLAKPADLFRGHSLFESVDRLLSPEALSSLIGSEVRRVRLLPFSSVDGRSGGHLQAVETDSSGHFVLKRITWKDDITMQATGDRAGRAVEIWEKGLLDRLPPGVEHGIVGCARDGDGWALLLRDFRGSMLPPHEQRI